jgi:hypothetical protein
VPFDFLRRKKGGDAATGDRPDPTKRPAATTVIRFDGLTEEWRLVGRMHLDTRLSDALNRREAVPISDVSWAPIDGSSGFTAVPGLKSVDPYDLIVVLAGEGSQGPLTEAEQEAYKIHRVPYDVALEAPPFRVVGTVYLLPGTEPERLLDRATEMFLPVVGGVVSVGDRTVSDPDLDAVLVNRFYLRGVVQVDKRTGEPAQKLPGAPLGGITWQDRTR